MRMYIFPFKHVTVQSELDLNFLLISEKVIKISNQICCFSRLTSQEIEIYLNDKNSKRYLILTNDT